MTQTWQAIDTRLLLALAGLFLALMVVLLLWLRLRAGRSRGAGEDDTPHSLRAVKDGRVQAGEREASPISEQIEEMVRRSLAQHPDLAGTPVDFASAPDGGLEIWIGHRCYREIDSIPDPRVRAAVAEAVATFNR